MWAGGLCRYFLQRTARQAKFWKPKHYEAIPHYVKPHFIDIHDSYTTRSIEEVEQELKGREFDITVEKVIYKMTDIQRDHKARRAVIVINMAQFELTQMQQARFEVLVGCRYNKEKNQLKVTCELFPDYDRNLTKVHEMFYEIVMETKRAP